RLAWPRAWRDSGGFSMKTESIGASAAEIGAETWPTEPPSGTAVRAPGPRRFWRRIVGGLVVIVALVATLLVAYGRPGDNPKTPSIAPVTLGSDGVPAQIDGQRVYRIGEQTEWQQLAGSFLLGAWPDSYRSDCPPSSTPVDAASAALADLVAPCGGYQLVARSVEPLGTGGNALAAAPLGSSVLRPWKGGLAVVRVHTHDPEAAQCNHAKRAECDAAVVAEEVVWPIVPMEFAGERVFRAADSATYGTLSHSFLFGGLSVYGIFMASVDGEQVSLASSFNAVEHSIATDGYIVVVRAHFNPPWAQCPSQIRAECASAIVVESVVWSYSPYTAPYAIVSPTPAQVGPSVGPIGPDGVPTSIDGRPVYRGSGNSVLTSAAAFLLGGRVARDGSCPTSPPSPNQDGASSSACSDWAVDGVPVSVVDGISPSLDGSLVVVDVVRSRVLSTCPTTSSCGSHEVLVVIGLVWEQPSAQRTATPGASR
ncbi:MAG TPA: hypothetical protein VFC12_02855, partial [Terriglobales bacterium]|nr:hypothetical protein [Terriglobales bacterium]